MIYIQEKDVKDIVNDDLGSVIETMREMFKTMSDNTYSLGGKGYSHGMRLNYSLNDDNNIFIAMPGYLGDPFNVSGVKWHGPNVKKTGIDKESHFLLILNNALTGVPKAIIPAGYITLYRTAAISILAASYLADENTKTIGIIGPGKINTLVAKGLIQKFKNVERIIIKGRSKNSISLFKSQIKVINNNIKLEVVDTFEEVVSQSNIVSINTGFDFNSISDMPIIRESWINKGTTFLCSAFVKFSDNFMAERVLKVCDLYEMYQSYADELGSPTYKYLSNLGNQWIDMIRTKKISPESIINFKDIIGKQLKVRTSKDDIILFSSGGFATEDLALAETVYRLAIKKGVGIELPY